MKVAQVFNPRLVIGLIAAGVLAFAAMLLLVAYGGGSAPSSGRDGRGHALSSAATGFKGLVTLVGEFRRARLVREGEGIQTENLLVVTVEQQTSPAAVTDLLNRRHGRATLLILPKWVTLPHPSQRGWVQALGPGTGQNAADLFGKDAEIRVVRGGTLPERARGERFLEGFSPPVPESPQVVGGSDLTPLVTLPGGDALVAQIGAGPHYVLADPDLLNNHGLRDPAAAQAALELIDRLNATGATGVDFDLTLNGFGSGANSGSVLRLAFEPPFLVMTLALAFAALLAGLHGAFRFGPTRREERAIAFGKAALVENSAGLIRLANREARLGAAYADVVRLETARLTAAPHWLQGEALDRYLDRMARPGRPPFSELASRLAAASDRHGLMAAARALSEWKKEIIR